MVMVNADEENNYSDYYTITEYGKTFKDNSPSIYYGGYGQTRFIGGHYTITTYLSLDNYNQKYKFLGEKNHKLNKKLQGTGKHISMFQISKCINTCTQRNNGTKKQIVSIHRFNLQ